MNQQASGEDWDLDPSQAWAAEYSRPALGAAGAPRTLYLTCVKDEDEPATGLGLQIRVNGRTFVGRWGLNAIPLPEDRPAYVEVSLYSRLATDSSGTQQVYPASVVEVAPYGPALAEYQVGPDITGPGRLRLQRSPGEASRDTWSGIKVAFAVLAVPLGIVVIALAAYLVMNVV